MSRRAAVLHAAVLVLADDGMRGLTHRAVDTRADLPQGSTSNVFRSRRALLESLTDHLAEQDVARWEALLAEDPSAGLAGLLTRWIERSLGVDRAQTQARYAVFLAAASDPGLAQALRRPRVRLEGWAGSLLASGPPPAVGIPAAMTLLDGLIFHQLCLPDPDFDPAPTVGLLLTATAGPDS